MKGNMHSFLLDLAIIFFLARLLGSILARFGVPAIIGEILTGLILGPSLFGLIQANDILILLAEIGIIFLLFQIGLEVDLDRLKKTGLRAAIVAILGVSLPLLGSFLVSYFILNLPAIVAFTIGGTLAATSIGITVRILRDIGSLETEASQMVLAAAVVDDIIGVLLLTFIYEFAKTGTIKMMTTFTYLFYILTFFLLAPLTAHLIALLIDVLARKLKSYDFVPSTILSLIFILAYLAKRVGAPEILGAFTGGLAFSRRFIVPFAASLRVSPLTVASVKNIIDPLVFVFTPLFFVYVGVQINFQNMSFSPLLFLYFLLFSILALISKGICGLIIKGTLKERIFVGLAMIPRGEVGIIFAEFGRLSGIFDENLYTVMIAVVAFTTLISPFLLKFYVQKTRLFEIVNL